MTFTDFLKVKNNGPFLPLFFFKKNSAVQCGVVAMMLTGSTPPDNASAVLMILFVPAPAVARAVVLYRDYSLQMNNTRSE